MKTKRIIIGGLCLLATMSLLFLSKNVFAKEVADGDKIIIEVQQEGESQFSPPRSVVPFFAERINNNVLLGCTDSIGTVTVELFSTAGDWMVVPFDTSTGSIVIPISGLSGHYELTITTLSGAIYTGEFDI